MEKISFFMSVYDQLHDADLALGSIRRHYPQARIMLFSCGDHAGFDGLSKRFGAEAIHTPNLHLSFYGGKIWTRILECFLQKPTEHLVKVDPDTRCHRMIDKLPPWECVWGHLQTCEPEGYSHIQGGCKGTGVLAAYKLLDSGAFDDPALSDPSTYCGPERLANLRETGLSCEDRYTQKVYEKVGVKIRHCDEIYSIFRGTMPRQLESRYAFTHPHKTC